MARGGDFSMRVSNQLPGYDARGVAAAAEAMRLAVDAGTALARAEAPVLSGRLKGAIRADSGRIVADTPYAAYQEFGTKRGIEGKHFVRHGVAHAIDVWPDILDRLL
jgi:hypothetical protein